MAAMAACPSSSSSAVQTTSRNPYESRGFSHIGGIAATMLQLGFFFSFFRSSSAQPMLPLPPSLYPKCVTFCLSAVTMADPLYSRSQMSTVAAAAIAAVRDCREGERQFQKGLWLPDVQPILALLDDVGASEGRERYGTHGDTSHDDDDKTAAAAEGGRVKRSSEIEHM